MKLSTSTALVTGAGNGMGRQLVIGLIKKGAKVAALDIDASALSETKRLAGASEDNFKAFVVDITDADKVGTLPKTIAEEFSPIDLLINNAGIIQPFVRINQLEKEAAEKVMQINFFGPFNLIKAFLPSLLEKKSAHIVNTSSIFLLEKITVFTFVSLKSPPPLPRSDGRASGWGTDANCGLSPEELEMLESPTKRKEL